MGGSGTEAVYRRAPYQAEGATLVHSVLNQGLPRKHVASATSCILSHPQLSVGGTCEWHTAWLIQYVGTYSF